MIKSVYSEGKSEDLEEGIRKKQLEIVRKMKDKDYSIKDIQELTGLSIEQINEIN